MGPTERVFGIHELLENILKYADREAMFYLQRVNKTWQAVIRHSPQLQDMMKFRGAVYDAEQTDFGDRRPIFDWNPLIHRVMVNSVEDLLTTPPDNLPTHIYYRIVCRFEESVLDPDHGCPKASWKGMLVTKPAIQKLLFESFNCCGHPPFTREILKTDGITFGDMIEAYEELMADMDVPLPPPEYLELKFDGALHLGFFI